MRSLTLLHHGQLAFTIFTITPWVHGVTHGVPTSCLFVCLKRPLGSVRASANWRSARASEPRTRQASAILFREKPPEHRLLAQELLREARAARERKNPSAEPIRGRVFGDERWDGCGSRWVMMGALEESLKMSSES